MEAPLISRQTCFFLFSLLGLVYVTGLFAPLMDNDAAHHADISLRMYLTGDYVNLVDNGTDYLDKPHLHFWLCALSYRVFGVNSFAYKFPSFLFTIGGTYSIYRLGKALMDEQRGRLAALIAASGFAYLLANSDVRMDAILVASIAFASWQLVAFIQNKSLLSAAAAGLGLALGFCTKGMIGVLLPLVGAFAYILYRRDGRSLFNWRWLIIITCFLILISPVLYCYYVQFNLHPEKMVRGRDHIDGVRFILLGQNVERLGGEFRGGSGDYLFFLYSFTWAFAPWSPLAWVALAQRMKRFFRREQEWFSTLSFLFVLVLLTLSGSKLPHYLNVVFPVAALMTADLIIRKSGDRSWVKFFGVMSRVIVVSTLFVALVLNVWVFPMRNTVPLVISIALLILLLYASITQKSGPLQKSIVLPVLASAFLFFTLNSNFYPRLLHYQGGNQVARAVKGRIDPEKIYFWKNTYSSSFCFYMGSLRQSLPDKVPAGSWLVYDSSSRREIEARGYQLGEKFESKDFEVSKLTLKFLDPRTRDGQCTIMVLARIIQPAERQLNTERN